MLMVESMYKVGFILEQALGHITHSENLRQNVPADPSIEPYWAPIEWDTHGLAAKVPLYNSNWTIRAGLRARRKVAQMARQAAPDVLFFHTQVPAIFSTDWIRRVPSIISLDATPLQYDSLGAFYGHRSGPAWLEQQKWKLQRDCFRAARQLVTWSDWARRGLVDDYEVPAHKVEVIPPGVNTADWTPPTPRKQHDGPVKILFVGGNLERKGGHLLLEAFRAIRDLGVELHLVTQSRLPEEAGLFVHTNVQPNSARLKALYHACDIFCLPTLGDCLPMVLSEAGAAGLPLVSTDVGAISEIVRDGETGFLVQPGDVDTLVARLRLLVENPELRLTLGQGAFALVQQHFDAPHNATRLLNLLKQTVDAARRTARSV